jgi:hypothetical protein
MWSLTGVGGDNTIRQMDAVKEICHQGECQDISRARGHEDATEVRSLQIRWGVMSKYWILYMGVQQSGAEEIGRRDEGRLRTREQNEQQQPLALVCCRQRQQKSAESYYHRLESLTALARGSPRCY